MALAGARFQAGLGGSPRTHRCMQAFALAHMLVRMCAPAHAHTRTRTADVQCFDAVYPCSECCSSSTAPNGAFCWDDTYTISRCCANQISPTVVIPPGLSSNSPSPLPVYTTSCARHVCACALARMRTSTRACVYGCMASAGMSRASMTKSIHARSAVRLVRTPQAPRAGTRSTLRSAAVG